ncbi:MAG: LCP family protein [Ilumatobacteraceae bacterium]
MEPDAPRHVLAPAAGALASMLLPGSGHLVMRVRRVWSMALLATVDAAVSAVVVAVLVSATNRAGLADLLADQQSFVGLGLGLVAMACTRLWAAADLAWRTRPRHRRGPAIVSLVGAALVTVVGVVPLVVAAETVRRTDRAVDDVFADHDAMTAVPTEARPAHAVYDPADGTVDGTAGSPVDGTTPATMPPGEWTGPVAPTTTVAPITTTTLPPIIAEDRVNVLLLGGDAGPGRWSLRTDSMVVVSINPISGDTAMISVPRNLTHIPFPAGTLLHEAYPNGFPEIANAVYPLVRLHPELVPGADDAGAQAIKMGIAQLLGMPIHYYVLVNMAGFVDVVDALGGIDIHVPKTVPSPGNPPGSKHDVPPTIEAGDQHMDGTIALAYARSRKADSDYQRMGRQRCVLAAIARAATPTAVATGITSLVDAFGGAVRTDIPRDRLVEMNALLTAFSTAGGLQAVRTLHLAPPLVDPARWDPLAIRAMVAAVVEPAAPAATSAPVDVPATVLADAC